MQERAIEMMKLAGWIVPVIYDGGDGLITCKLESQDERTDLPPAIVENNLGGCSMCLTSV